MSKHDYVSTANVAATDRLGKRAHTEQRENAASADSIPDAESETEQAHTALCGTVNVREGSCANS